MPRAARIDSASSSEVASSRAAAIGTATASARRGSKRNAARRRDPRDGAAPVADRRGAGRAARAGDGLALASVGTAATAASRRSRGRAACPDPGQRAAGGRARRARSSTSSSVSSPSQAGAPDRDGHGRAVGGRGEQQRVRQRAAEPRLVAVGEDVAAHVDERDEIAAEPPRGVVERGRRPRRGRGAGSTRTVSLAEHAGQVRLGEAEAAGPARLGAGERDGVVQALARRRSRRACGARERVDEPPLPGQPADDRVERRSARPGLGETSAPTTSPPPPMPTTRTREAALKSGRRLRVEPPVLRESGHAARHDRARSPRGALELVVGEHRRALERQVARDLQPRAAARRTRP